MAIASHDEKVTYADKAAWPFPKSPMAMAIISIGEKSGLAIDHL
ncbi:MAG: hypothetical protein M2R45_01027 [Verrucomicrobia subdivision 3 bacterium]|nr:hypothetical protein [Limisphaerales bacterium]MCS1414139.1 hypothetical protein [Limisphaerales bacterium]